MTNLAYKTKSGLTQFKPVVSEQEFRHPSKEYGGFCLNCGEFVPDGIEPDARNYVCDSYEQPKVYGLAELLIINLLVLTEPNPP